MTISVKCGGCDTIINSTTGKSTICTECIKKINAPKKFVFPEIPADLAFVPRVIWEGKGLANGDQVSNRAVLGVKDGKKAVIFEYAYGKDAMGVTIWKQLPPVSTPDQFILDAADMMDTAFHPNRKGTPTKKLYLITWKYHDSFMAYLASLTPKGVLWLEETLSRSSQIHQFHVRLAEEKSEDDMTDIVREEGLA